MGNKENLEVRKCKLEASERVESRQETATKQCHTRC